MSDTEIETVIRRLLLFKKTNNKENEKHIEDIEKQLIKICGKFHFFNKKIISNKNIKNNEQEKIILDILEHLEFIYLKENEIIWKVGDKINEMFIIFLGEVNIYKQQNKNDEKEPILELTLEKGFSLGEDFFKNKCLRRTYQTKTKTFCILGKLSSKDYFRIFNKLLYDENALINSFLRELKLFTHEFVERFQKYVFINYYNKNDYIFKQNEPFNTFYFIFSGTVRLTSNLKKFVKSKIDYDILIGKNKKRFTESRLFEIKGFYKESINYNLIDLSYGDIIGGIEYINNFHNYRYNVKCLTDVQVLKIDINHFNQIRTDDEMKIFNKKIENQTELISLRIKLINEGRKKAKIKDYILSKDKFTKAFLINNPLSKKSECKTELYINSSSKKLKLKEKYSKKKLKNTKISPILIEEYISEKNKFKRVKSNTIIGTKDFMTNIDYNNQVPVGQIFPSYFSIENIPTHKHAKLYINNKNEKNIKSNSANHKHTILKNMSSNSSLSYSNNLKNKLLNTANSNSLKVLYNDKFEYKNEMKNKIIFNNKNIREKMYMFLNKKFSKNNRFKTTFNSFRTSKYKTINYD